MSKPELQLCCGHAAAVHHQTHKTCATNHYMLPHMILVGGVCCQAMQCCIHHCSSCSASMELLLLLKLTSAKAPGVALHVHRSTILEVKGCPRALGRHHGTRRQMWPACGSAPSGYGPCNLQALGRWSRLQLVGMHQIPSHLTLCFEGNVAVHLDHWTRSRQHSPCKRQASHAITAV
jgi:hypothetical protein